MTLSFSGAAHRAFLHPALPAGPRISCPSRKPPEPTRRGRARRLVTNRSQARRQQMEAVLPGLEILNSWAQDTAASSSSSSSPGRSRGRSRAPRPRTTGPRDRTTWRGLTGGRGWQPEHSGTRRTCPEQEAQPCCARVQKQGQAPAARSRASRPSTAHARTLLGKSSPRPREWPGTGAEPWSQAGPEARCLLLPLTCSVSRWSYPDTPAALATRGQAGQVPTHCPPACGWSQLGLRDRLSGTWGPTP